MSRKDIIAMNDFMGRQEARQAKRDRNRTAERHSWSRAIRDMIIVSGVFVLLGLVLPTSGLTDRLFDAIVFAVSFDTLYAIIWHHARVKDGLS